MLEVYGMLNYDENEKPYLELLSGDHFPLEGVDIVQFHGGWGIKEFSHVDLTKGFLKGNIAHVGAEYVFESLLKKDTKEEKASWIFELWGQKVEVSLKNPANQQYPDTHIIQVQDGSHIRVEHWDDVEEVDMETSLTIFGKGLNPKGESCTMELTLDEEAKNKLIKVLMS